MDRAKCAYSSNLAPDRTAPSTGTTTETKARATGANSPLSGSANSRTPNNAPGLATRRISRRALSMSGMFRIPKLIVILS